MSDQKTGDIKEKPKPIPLAEFLEGSPPGNEISVTDLAEPQHSGLPTTDYIFASPDIRLQRGTDSQKPQVTATSLGNFPSTDLLRQPGCSS